MAAYTEPSPYSPKSAAPAALAFSKADSASTYLPNSRNDAPSRSHTRGGASGDWESSAYSFAAVGQSLPSYAAAAKSLREDTCCAPAAAHDPASTTNNAQVCFASLMKFFSIKVKISKGSRYSLFIYWAAVIHQKKRETHMAPPAAHSTLNL